MHYSHSLYTIVSCICVNHTYIYMYVCLCFIQAANKTPDLPDLELVKQALPALSLNKRVCFAPR